MPTLSPLFLPLLAFSLALGGCDAGVGSFSSERATPENSVAVAFPTKPKLLAGIPEEVAVVAKNDCMSCHAADNSIMGAPPFPVIAQHYAGNGNATTILENSLTNGSHGKWSGSNEKAMPPHPQLSASEKKTLVQWTLSQ